MKKPKSRAARRRNLVVRLYVLLLSMILGLSVTALISQTAQATTYVISDGQRVVTCNSFATDPAEVLGQAGVSLNEYDTYTTEAGEEGRTILINRAQTITIYYHGQTTRASSLGETAGELLDRLDLEVSGEDVVSVGLEELTYDGMEISVDHVVTAEESYTTTLPHGISYCSDASIPEGVEAVLTEGRDGELLCTAEVTYINGKETGRRVLTETVTQNPVEEIVGVGAGEGLGVGDPEELPVIEEGYITLPTGEVLTYTRTDTVRATAYTHTDAGCDLVTSTGSTVRWGTVAVDPRYIPYGTRMFIMASDGSYVYGVATAEDCGGDIKGDRMDLYMPTYEQCREFGRRRCTIYFLG